MARKGKPAPVPEPTYVVIVSRPNGDEYARLPAEYLSDLRPITGEAWRSITTEHGWMPGFKVIRTRDGADVTNFI